MFTAEKITAEKLTGTKLTALKMGETGSSDPSYISNFNGEDSYVEFDNGLTLSSSFEMCCTFNLNDTTTQCIFDSDGSAFFRLDNSYRMGFRDDSGQGYDISGDDLAINTDYSMRLVWDAVSQIFSIYLNDVVWGTKTITTWAGFTLDILARRSNGSDHLNGTMCDVIIIDDGATTIDLPMNEDINPETGNVDYVNRTGNTDYDATGYNITTTEI